MYRSLLWIQGSYILLTALWGLIDIDSFMKVTGPKTDIWLVKTVSVALIPIAINFFFSLYVPTKPLPVMMTGISASAGLAAVDFYYTARGIIKWVYGVDGALETLFLICWIWLLATYRKEGKTKS